MHKMARYKRIQAWKEATAEQWVAHHGRRVIDDFVIVHLEIPFKVKRRRDPHNYCGTVLKACVDGLVVAGIIPDDNSDILGHREPILKVGGEVVLSLESRPR